MTSCVQKQVYNMPGKNKYTHIYLYTCEKKIYMAAVYRSLMWDQTRDRTQNITVKALIPNH